MVRRRCWRCCNFVVHRFESAYESSRGEVEGLQGLAVAGVFVLFPRLPALWPDCDTWLIAADDAMAFALFAWQSTSLTLFLTGLCFNSVSLPYLSVQPCQRADPYVSPLMSRGIMSMLSQIELTAVYCPCEPLIFYRFVMAED